MKKRLFDILLLCILIPLMISVIFSFSGCENYISCEEINSLFVKNDLDIEFNVLQNKDYIYEFETFKDNRDGKNYLLIDVENKFSVSSNRIPIKADKSYKLIITLRNDSADPLLLYSFWEDSLKESRYFTLAGENGNPPESETQNINKEWVSYEETFRAQENENFIMIRIYSNKGTFSIKDISIEEM